AAALGETQHHDPAAFSHEVAGPRAHPVPVTLTVGVWSGGADDAQLAVAKTRTPIVMFLSTFIVFLLSILCLCRGSGLVPRGRRGDAQHTREPRSRSATATLATFFSPAVSATLFPRPSRPAPISPASSPNPRPPHRGQRRARADSPFPCGVDMRLRT